MRKFLSSLDFLRMKSPSIALRDELFFLNIYNSINAKIPANRREFCFLKNLSYYFDNFSVKPISIFKPTASMAVLAPPLESPVIMISGTSGCADLARASATPTFVL